MAVQTLTTEFCRFAWIKSVKISLVSIGSPPKVRGQLSVSNKLVKKLKVFSKILTSRSSKSQLSQEMKKKMILNILSIELSLKANAKTCSTE